MVIERCPECGFDSERWTDIAAVTAIAGLPSQWRAAVSEVPSHRLGERPIPEMWSIAEYADHVREIFFGQRFLLDTALARSGSDLGEPPETRFDHQPRVIDIEACLAGIESEARALRDQLSGLSGPQWDRAVTVGGNELDVHWIARHAVHDANHHLLDVDRLRQAL